MQITLIVIGLIIIFLIWTLLEQKQLVTTKYIVSTEKFSKESNPISFVILTDLHNSLFGPNNRRLYNKIEELSPEFIVIAGDMINRKEASYPSNTFTLLKQLANKYKIYYAYGNHEQWMERRDNTGIDDEIDRVRSTWVEYKDYLTKAGVTFLNNESCYYSKNNQQLRITGISLNKRFFEHGKQPIMEEGYIESKLGIKQEGVYELLIAHNPVYFHEYTKWGADLTVSGHLHGGLVRIPGIGGILSPQVLFFPKYSAGIFTENDKHMIVSRGLGSHSIMPRIFNPPEIVSVILKNEK